MVERLVRLAEPVAVALSVCEALDGNLLALAAFVVALVGYVVQGTADQGGEVDRG